MWLEKRVLDKMRSNKRRASLLIDVKNGKKLLTHKIVTETVTKLLEIRHGVAAVEDRKVKDPKLKYT